MAIFGSLLGLLTPIVSFIISYFIKDAAKKAAAQARWDATVAKLNKRTNVSIDMSLEYDRLVQEQDERLAAEALKKAAQDVADKLNTPPAK